MKIFRSLGYFLRLQKIFGSIAAARFVAAYVTNLFIKKPLYRVPVGNYVFYYPSALYFSSLFMEIFLQDAYYLPQTDAPITAIDAGAHIGVALLYIKMRAPNARVLCFEPNPASRVVLEKNVAANGWQHEVVVYPYALGAHEGSAPFFVDQHMATSTSASLSPQFKPKLNVAASHTVEIKKLSSFITEPVDFLKIDIEGGEREVLEDLITSGKQKVIHVVDVL
jgi:FkbM family methyltransferase